MSKSSRLIVRSSHLALRFYTSDGWTKDLLQEYVIDCKPDTIIHQSSMLEGLDYFILDIGTKVKVDQLCEFCDVQDYTNKFLYEYFEKRQYVEQLTW